MKQGSDQEAEGDDDNTERVYRFGTGKKTRYKPHRVFLTFDVEKELFVAAKNPDDEVFQFLHGVISDINKQTAPKQTAVINRALEIGEHNLTDKKIRSLLRHGTGKFWTTEKGQHNSTIFRPIQFGSFPDLYRSGKLPNWHQCTGQPDDNLENRTCKTPLNPA